MAHVYSDRDRERCLREGATQVCDVGTRRTASLGLWARLRSRSRGEAFRRLQVKMHVSRVHASIPMDEVQGCGNEASPELDQLDLTVGLIPT